jgi:hypothetical protein
MTMGYCTLPIDHTNGYTSSWLIGDVSIQGIEHFDISPKGQ